MMSAFGVEHPDVVSKASFGSLGTKIAGKTTQVGNKLRRAGGRNTREAPYRAFGGAKTKGVLQQATGAGQLKAGGALKKLGAGMASRPGLTGGAAAGGAAATLGAGASSYSRRNRGY